MIQKFTKLPERSSRSGFALIATMSVMVLLVMVSMGVMSLSKSQVRNSKNYSAKMEAQANARMALVMALGDLQKAMGPDQRVSAVADLLADDAGNAPQDGRSRWVGVWDTSEYSPENLEKKKFVRWLVSSKHPGDVIAESAASKLVLGSEEAIFRGVGTNDSSSAEDSVVVEKVETDNGAYAYWIEDEGVKADLGWYEGDFDSDQQRSASRLASMPGVDHGVFGGPFASGMEYPIEQGSAFVSSLEKSLSEADMPLVMGGATDNITWLKQNRHDMTFGSRGVMADVKNGGLRRDLSLAFEMDGDADVTANDQPRKFNQQEGEFVGGDDNLVAPNVALGMPVKERFLYRVTKNDGSPFSGDLVRGNSVVRGPNWWALRDYANLYKRLSGGEGNYTLGARSYYPNVSAANPSASDRHEYNLGVMYGANSGVNTWDHEQYLGPAFRVQDSYLFKPARANYSPVLLGSLAVFSARSEANQLTLGVDPFFYLWNPYNCTLSVDNYAIKLTNFAGHVTFWVTKQGQQPQRYGPTNVSKYLQQTAGSWGNLSYLVQGLTMEPGDVIVVSPSSSRPSNASVFHDVASPGTNIDNESGAALTRFPKITGYNTNAAGEVTGETITWSNVTLDPSDQVGFLYSVHNGAKTKAPVDASDPSGATKDISAGDQGMSEHVWMDAFLAPAGITANSLNNNNNFGEHIQQIGNNAAGDLSVPEYFDPPRPNHTMQLSPPTVTVSAATLVGAKRFFGITNYLAKPAIHAGGLPNPVEVFSQFNPFPIGGYDDMWRPCLLNQTFASIADPGEIDALLFRAGIQFPASKLSNGYWGESYSSGSTSLPLLNIPAQPLYSLAEFSHANLTLGAHKPWKSVGNSWSSLFVPATSTFGPVTGMSWVIATAADNNWLINNALFDGYYLSGIAPEYKITGSGYSETGSIQATLTQFFGENPESAQVNPVLAPYVPVGVESSDVVDELAADDGYKKTGAYSLIQGSFNVNSTSKKAWEAFLRGNRNMDVANAQGGTETGSGVPFPNSPSPAADGNGAASYWSGFSRLSDSQVEDLAEAIVEQVKLRGPFMGIADFVNRRVGGNKSAKTHYMGALQAAIEEAGINSKVQNGAGGVAPEYSGVMNKYFPDPLPVGSRKTSSGIPTDITQADLLLPLAPRVSVRSDTFRIRAYGEARDKNGKILASAVCEAVVQRFPEYVDEQNKPWEDNDSTTSDRSLTEKNNVYGRRFRVLGFRWLPASEI